MKKALSMTLALTLSFLCVMPFASCGKEKVIVSDYTEEEEQEYFNSFNAEDYPIKEDVTVSVQITGLGKEWLQNMADNYKKITGITVWVKENDATSTLRNKINIDRGFDDMYFTYESAREWNEWASQGKIEKLNDIVDGIADFRSEEIDTTLTYNDDYYTMPFAYQPVGFVYNQDYLDVINSNGEYVKGQWPTTWKGLLDLCEAVQKSNLKVGATKVQPLVWGGTVWDMTYIFKGLWAQYDYNGFRAYWSQNDKADFKDDLFDTEATQKAMQAIRDLLNPQVNTNGDYYPANAVNGSAGINNTAAETKFLNGAAVFTISGTWFENEMKETITTEDFYHFGALPLLEGCTENTAYINLPGEHFIIPSKAGNAKGAKQFLKFVLQEQNLVRIHDSIQTPLAYKYSTDGVKFTRWGKEVNDITTSVKGAICYSGSEVMHCGALQMFEAADPFVAMATKGITASEAIRIEKEKRLARFADYIKLIPQK